MNVSVATVASAAFLLANASAVFPSNAKTQCAFNKIAEINLNMDKGTPRAPVSFNGQAGYLIFANRSNVTAVYKDAAEKLGLKLYSTDDFTIRDGKEAPVYGMHVRAFEVGGMSPTTVDFFSADRPQLSEQDSWGQISTSFFPGDDIDFDFSTKRVIIYSEKYCEGQIHAPWDAAIHPLDVEKQDLATFTGVVDGMVVPVQINSTQKASTINDSAVKLAKLILENDSTHVASSSIPARSGDMDAYTGKVAMIHKIVIAGETIENVGIPVKNRSTVPSKYGHPLGSSRLYDEESPKIVLGIDYLSTHHILISPSQRKIFVSSTGGSSFVSLPLAAAPVSKSATP